MNHVWPATLFTCLVFVASMHGQQQSSNSDEAGIRQIVQQYVDARNNKDGVAVRTLLTADADQLVSTGEWRRGIDALVRGAMASSQKETGKSSIAIDSIRFVDDSVAIADGRYETSTAATGQSRNMWTTLVLKRTNVGWRITAIRNMLPAPAPAH